MNWQAAGFSVAGAVLGSFVGLGIGRALAPKLKLKEHNGDAHRYAGSSLLVGASIGAIIGASLASSPPAKASGGSPITAPAGRTTAQ